MRIKKVLVLAPCLSAIGGVQSYTKTLVAALEEIIGSDGVRVVAISREPETQANGTLGLSRPAKLGFFVRAWGAAMVWRPNLVICAHLGVAPAAQIIRKFRAIPYWLVIHGIEVWANLPPAKQRALRGAQRYIALTRFTLNATVARHALGTPQCVILPPPLSAPLADAAPAWAPPVDAPPLRAQTLGTPPLSERPDISASTGSAPLCPDRPIVLTVGRLASAERYKGHDVMLETWPAVIRAVPHAEYWIVGDGDDRQRLELRAKDLNIANSVRFMGTLSGTELNAAYDGCRVFAMPARTELNGDAPQGEGFGIVFQEAMSHAKPVVAPRTGAPAEFIRSGEHGFLVDPCDRTEIARGVIALLTDVNLARQMGKNAQEWVRREFTRENFLARLKTALEQDQS